MYINNLGTRDVAKLHSHTGSGNNTIKGKDSFAEKLQKAVEQSMAGQTDTDSCCEKCNQTNQLVSRMMLQSIYMQSGLGGMGMMSLMGLSSMGAGNLTSYLGMMNALGSNWLT